MNLQLCLCGAMPGYLHATDCPRPIYRASDEQEREWERDRAEIRHARRVREIAERGGALNPAATHDALRCLVWPCTACVERAK